MRNNEKRSRLEWIHKNGLGTFVPRPSCLESKGFYGLGVAALLQERENTLALLESGPMD
jgi:hypothetical protein